MKTIYLTLSDGLEVQLIETRFIDDEACDSYSVVDILDLGDNEVIGSYIGTLPDPEDEDFDIEAQREKIEKELDY